MPRFVFIPDKTPDLRNCGTRRWGAGVDVQVDMLLKLRPVSIVRDGNDGAFMLTTKINATNTQETELRIHHIDASGIPTTPSVVLSTFSNVWFYDAFLVPSATGTCIAIFTAAGWGNQIRAQRFDSNLSPMWAAPVALSPTNKGIAFVAAASDRNNGALVAFKDNSGDAAALQAFRVQRITVNGSLPWGTAGTVIVSPGTSPQIPFASPQIAAGPNEFAVVWEGWQLGPGPASVFGAWVDYNGALVSGPFTAGTTLEIVGLSHKWVASDPGGGFYVARQAFSPTTNTVDLTLSRFDNLATTASWTTAAIQVAGGGTYALAEDGSGGALLATLNTAGNIKLAAFNAQNTNVWSAAAAANAATVAVLSPPSPTNPHQMAGSLAVAAKTAGVMLVFSDWQQPAAPRLHTQCFDSAGAFFGASSVVAGPPGSQLRPLVADMVIPTSTPTGLVKPVFGGKLTLVDPEKDSIILMWQGKAGVNGSSITAQKLGCCKKHFNGVVVTVPEFACGVPIDWPTNLPGNINAIFPCGSPKGTFGLLPVPQLALVPDANLPGGLATPNVPSPDWVRMWFENVPPDVTIELRSHKNQVIGAAIPLELPENVAHLRGQSATLTFQPSNKLSYVLIFNRPREGDRPPVVPIGLRMEFGNGETPAISLPGRRAPRRRKKAARKSARKPVAGKSAKRTRKGGKKK